ncbi:MAG: tetratricopeptide repeat protein [Deltaproteobacteria bacterium]|nr:tetratricopeptide repeat protein [Deltaproteobacteria bacterium]
MRPRNPGARLGPNIRAFTRSWLAPLVTILSSSTVACQSTAASEATPRTGATRAPRAAAADEAGSAGTSGHASRPDARRRAAAVTLNQAKRQAAQGNLTEAIGLCRKAIAEDSAFEEAYLLLGSAWAMIGDQAPEIEAYRQGLTVLPNSAALHNELGMAELGRGDVERAIEALEKARALSREGDAKILADLAYAYTFAHRNDEAEQWAKNARDLDPKCFQCAMAYGEVLRQKKKFELAAESFEAAVKLAPEDPAPKVSLAKVRYLAGRPAEALDLYDALLKTMPDEPALLTQSSQVLLALSRAREAVERLTAADRLAPNTPAILRLLAEAQAQAGARQDAQKTEEKLRKITKEEKR